MQQKPFSIPKLLLTPKNNEGLVKPTKSGSNLIVPSEDIASLFQIRN
jgi:hypothetical protein